MAVMAGKPKLSEQPESAGTFKTRVELFEVPLQVGDRLGELLSFVSVLLRCGAGRDLNAPEVVGGTVECALCFARELHGLNASSELRRVRPLM